MNNPQQQHLIAMINQISRNNSHCGNDQQCAEVVASHIQKFWARSMKQQIITYAASGGDELSTISKLAVKCLGAPENL